MIFNLSFWDFWKFWGFSKSKRFLQNFLDGFWRFDLKNFIHCISWALQLYFHAFRYVLYMFSAYVLVGLDWAEPMMQLSLHVTCSCIPMHAFFLFNIFWYIWTTWDFSDCLFLPFSLLFMLVCFYGTQTQIYSVLEPSSFRGIHFFRSYSLTCLVLWWEGQIGPF